ncbi:mitochondrial ribosomal subunit s27 domain-containing protein [Ditylenchus destructor]|uniref:Small ribosomal subunit protein mS33 n=1 Tax=Ditylenchus destructor TaxID=166010 RepID=A0AAD4MS67_9BILA|nr:mitochondrial ribosomal subunit s27 domain-containing protein [Ditylenchus destructor]
MPHKQFARIMPSRLAIHSKGLDTNTIYAKRMDRLSKQIFTEVTRPIGIRSQNIMKMMSEEPWEQREDKSVNYFPNQPMFHNLSKLLSLHGLFFDDHTLFDSVQRAIKELDGRLKPWTPGEGKADKPGQKQKTKNVIQIKPAMEIKEKKII